MPSQSSILDQIPNASPTPASAGPLDPTAKPPGWRKDDELLFRNWYVKARAAAKAAAGIDLDPDPDAPEHRYNYRFAFKSGAWPDPATGHWPSEFKAADHPNRFVDGQDTITGKPGTSILDDIPDALADIPDAKPTASSPKERRRSLGFMTFPEEETGAFVPGPREFASRMIRQLFGPIDPVHQVAKKLAGVVDPTPQPAREDPRFETPTDLPGYAKAGAAMAAAPLLTIADIVRNLAQAGPQAATALVREPAATLRGGLAGMIEGASSLSPLDALFLKGAPAAVRSAVKARGIPDILRSWGRETPPVKRPFTGRVLDPSKMPPDPFPPKDPDLSPVSTGDLAVEAIDEMRNPGAAPPTSTSLPPSDAPPRGTIQSWRGPTGGAIPDPGGMVGFAEESGAKAVQAATRLKQLQAERNSALDQAHRAQIREAEKIAREVAKDKVPGKNEPPVPGTTRAKAYGKGATPAEAAKAVAEARTAESLTARSAEAAKQVELPKAEPAEIPPEVAERAQAEVLKHAAERASGPRPGESLSQFQRRTRRTFTEAKAVYEAKATPQTQFGKRPPLGTDELIAAGEEAGIGPPPSGVEPDMWAKINAVEHEARDLHTKGIHDPRLLGQLREFWGADEAAARLGMEGKAGGKLIRDVTGGPKRQPLTRIAAETEARFRHLIEDPRGFMRTEALLAATGAGIGGLIGAQIDGEDVLDRVAYGISGAIIGGGAGLAGGAGVRWLARNAKNPAMRHNTAQVIETLDTANLLAGPAMIKASLGSFGGIAAGLWERIREGKSQAARNAMKFIVSPNGMVKTYWDALTAPTANMRPIGAYTNAVAGKMGFFAPTTNKITTLARQVLRPFIAADAAGSEVLRIMGYSKEEAGRMMLNGEPTSWQGQYALRIINSIFPLRMLIKFPRVRLTGLERGIEYMPGMGKVNTRPLKTGVPGYVRSGFKESDQLSQVARRARREFGGAALVLGTAYGYFGDPSFQEAGTASAAAGPAFLPAAMGIAAGSGLRHGREPLTEMLKAAASSVPQIGEADLRTSNLIRRFTPLGPLRRAIERMNEK